MNYHLVKAGSCRFNKVTIFVFISHISRWYNVKVSWTMSHCIDVYTPDADVRQLCELIYGLINKSFYNSLGNRARYVYKHTHACTHKQEHVCTSYLGPYYVCFLSISQPINVSINLDTWHLKIVITSYSGLHQTMYDYLPN